MDMSMAVVFLCILLKGTLSGLILPMTQPDGTADISSIINHVSSLEKTVADLQKTTGQLKTDLQTSRSLHQSANKEIAFLKDEVASLKADLRLSTDELNFVKAEIVNQGKGDLQLNQTNQNFTSLGMASDSAQVNSVQSDVKMLRDQLDLLNTTVYDVKSVTDGFIQRTSPIFQLIAQSQLIENMKSANLLAQNTSKQLAQFEQVIKTTTGDILNVTQDLQSLNADLQSAKQNLSLTSSEVTALQTDMEKEKNLSRGNKHSLWLMSQSMQSLMGDLNTTEGNILNVTHGLQSVNADLQSTKQNLNLTSSKVTALKDDVEKEKHASRDNKQSLAQSMQKMKSVMGDLHATQDKLNLTSSEVTNLKRNLSTVEGQISNLRQGNDTPPIAFNVYDPANQVPGKPLIFTEHHYNAGLCYNSSTGRFTAPVTGTYMFWTQLVLTVSNSTTYVYIMKNDGWMAMDTDIKDYHASVMVVDHVDKGSDVWVEASSSHNITLRFASSHFGGVLLSKD